ncbi:MAG: c-type cytochrome [Candidatus Acidiferrales bacterium]
MKSTHRMILCLLVLLPVAIAASSPELKQGDIERGRYLVEEVAKCGECHTPRDERGNLEKSRWLQGGAIWIQPTHPTPNWANHAPALAGFPGFTQEQGEQILEKGIGGSGQPLLPPMHIYHMTHADSVAIIAYLRSLPSPTRH